MPANILNTLDDFVENMSFQVEATPLIADLVTILNAYRITNAVILSTPMDQGDKNAALKVYTGCVVSTQTDLNCYPVGLATTQCFDINGDPTA